MADPNSGARPEKKHRGSELVIPVAALLFTIYYFTTILEVPWTAQVSAFFVGTVLIVCVAILIVRIALEIRRGEADLGLSSLIEPVNYLPKRLALLGLTIGYIFFIQWGGFTLTSFVFLSCAMLVLSGGRRKGLIVALSATLAICGWLLFVVAFETKFPEGPWEHAMGGLF